MQTDFLKQKTIQMNNDIDQLKIELKDLKTSNSSLNISGLKEEIEKLKEVQL